MGIAIGENRGAQLRDASARSTRVCKLPYRGKIFAPTAFAARLRTWIASVLLAVSMLPCGQARATCTETSPENAGTAADPRVSVLVREADHARTWRYVWSAINAGLTLLPVAGLMVLPKSEHGDLLVSAGVSAISTAFTWFWPLEVEDDAERAARLRPSTVGDCDTELSRLLLHSTKDEASRFAWPWHVGNFVTALIPAAIILFAFHDRQNAALALGGGFALGEVELLTQPTALMDRQSSKATPTTGKLGPFVLGYRATW
jgi:hypothetical protein